MALVAHPDRDNVWVKPELIKPEWITQEWIRPESGFEFLSNEPAWKGIVRAGYDGSAVSATDADRVSVTIDLRPISVQIG
ncbi:MAG TPA: hypothetical protein VM848_05115 [Acidimicrobiia bacterium]|nr:hypothetical protein [Acidimicrobiia bacterium]